MKWLRCFLIICILSCSCLSKKQKPSLPQIYRAKDNRALWLTIAPFVKNHFKTDKSIEWIAADLALAEYLLWKKNEK